MEATTNDVGGHILGGFEIYFDRHSKAAPQALEPFRVMLTFNVDDIQKTYEELKEKELSLLRIQHLKSGVAGLLHLKTQMEIIFRFLN